MLRKLRHRQKNGFTIKKRVFKGNIFDFKIRKNEVDKIDHANALSSRSNHRRCSVKKVFLEISQNSQENTCARVSFLIKLQALQLY